MLEQARALGVDMVRAYRILHDHRKVWGAPAELVGRFFEASRSLADFRPTTKVSWVAESPDITEFRILLFLLRSRASRLHPKLSGEVADLVRGAFEVLTEAQEFMLGLSRKPIDPAVKKERWYQHFEPNR